jgi:S1-C subfamily serine protease
MLRALRARVPLPLVLLAGLLLAACVAPVTDPQAQAEQAAATAVAQVLATLTAQPTPTPAAAPAGTPTPAAHTSTQPPPGTKPSAALSPVEIFQRLSPSVAYIEVPDGTGSGVLIEGGYIVTNAHVLWPFQEARVVFANGEEHTAVPVSNVDHLTDLAGIGPIETDLPPVVLGSGEHLSVGEEVYLIGYPGEGDRFPQPALSRGLVSRMREWSSLGISYFQSDAAIAGGQSGGMFVSPQGEVIGISGFSFAEGNFALVASTADLAPRVAALLAGEDIDGLDPRDLLLAGERMREEYAPAHYYDQQTYVINEPEGTDITVRAEGDDEIYLRVEDDYGEYLIDETNEDGPGELEGEVFISADAPYFVVVGPAVHPPPGEIRVRASRPLAPFVDPDDERTLAVGDSISGQIDHGSDMDVFRLRLERGERVRILVDSIEIDPYLTVDGPNMRIREILSDDDAGGGLFGLNAAITFEAPRDDNYMLVVEDASGYDNGGYVISVTPADARDDGAEDRGETGE